MSLVSAVAPPASPPAPTSVRREKGPRRRPSRLLLPGERRLSGSQRPQHMFVLSLPNLHWRACLLTVCGTQGADKKKDDDDDDDDHRYQDPENEVGLFAGGAYDEDDDEADRIYQAVDEKMEKRRKSRRYTPPSLPPLSTIRLETHCLSPW